MRPVSGGEIGAINGTLTVMVGGEVKAAAAELDAKLPLLPETYTLMICGVRWVVLMRTFFTTPPSGVGLRKV